VTVPKFLGLDKQKWVWIGVAVAAVVGLYLLTQQGSGAGSASDAGLPVTGPPQLGNMTPPGGGFFDQGEEVASRLSGRGMLRELRLFKAAQDIPTAGYDPVPEPEHRTMLNRRATGAPKTSRGPLAWFNDTVVALVGGAIGAAAGGAPVTLGSAGAYAIGQPQLAKKKKAQTPPIAPTPRWGNAPAPEEWWRVPEV
jgi:hypothetical protein